MKINKNKLILLINELLNENLDLTIPQLSQIKNISDYKDLKTFLSSLGPLIFEGSSRYVHDIDPGWVLKVPIFDRQWHPRGIYGNKIEADLSLKYPKFVPKVLDSDPQGYWIIQEKLEVFQGGYFTTRFVNNFKALKQIKQIINQNFSDNKNIDNILFVILIKFLRSFNQGAEFLSASTLRYFKEFYGIDLSKILDFDNIFYDILVMDEKVSDFADFCVVSKILYTEIHDKNVGFNSSGEFRIIDIGN
jgi:hypothetical protein